MLPKLEAGETLSTLISYVMIVAVTVALIIFGIRIERHLLAIDCNKGSHIEIDGEWYRCEKEEIEFRTRS